MAFNPTLTLPTSSQWTNTMAPRIGQTRGPIDVWAGHQNMSVSRLTADDMRSTFTRNNVSMITNLPTASTLSKKPEDNWNRFITPYVPIFVLRNRVDRVRVDPLDMRPGQDSQFEHYSYALPLLCMNSFLTRNKCNVAQNVLTRVMQEQKQSAGWNVRVSGGPSPLEEVDARIGARFIGDEYDDKIKVLSDRAGDLTKLIENLSAQLSASPYDPNEVFNADLALTKAKKELEEAETAEKLAISENNARQKAIREAEAQLSGLKTSDVANQELEAFVKSLGDSPTKKQQQEIAAKKAQLAQLEASRTDLLQDIARQRTEYDSWKISVADAALNAPALKRARVTMAEATLQLAEQRRRANTDLQTYESELQDVRRQMIAVNASRPAPEPKKVVVSTSTTDPSFRGDAPPGVEGSPKVEVLPGFGRFTTSSEPTTPTSELSEGEDEPAAVDPVWNPDKHADDRLSEFQIEQYVRLQEETVSNPKASYSVKFGPVAHQLEAMRYLTPKLIMQQIVYMGIQGTQANLIEDVNKTEGGMNLSADGAPPVLSLVMRSMTYAMNIWPGAHTGQQLWFLLKRVQLDAPTPEQVRSDPAKQELPLDQSKWSHFQFVPYVSRGLSKHVEYEDTLYLGYGGQIEQAYVIHVGEASIEPTKVDKWDKNQALLAAGVHTRSSLNRATASMDNGAPTVFEAAYANNELGTIKLVVNPAYLGDMAMTHC